MRPESHAVVTCTSSEFLDLSWKAFEDSTDFSMDVSLGCSDMAAYAWSVKETRYEVTCTVAVQQRSL